MAIVPEVFRSEAIEFPVADQLATPFPDRVPLSSLTFAKRCNHG